MEALNQTEVNKRVAELADDDFLETIIEIAKLYGWDGDFQEICDFIEFIAKAKGKNLPGFDPYEVFGNNTLIP